MADVLIMIGESWMAESVATDESSAPMNGFLSACVLVVAVSAATNRFKAACELMVKDMSLTFTVVCVSVATAVLLVLMGLVAAGFWHLS